VSRELKKMRKSTEKKLVQARTALIQNEQPLEHLSQIQAEYSRVTDVSRRAPAIIENIDKQFKAKTKLTDSDIVFLFVATALQCTRQYLFTNDKFRITDKQGDMMIQIVHLCFIFMVEKLLDGRVL